MPETNETPQFAVAIAVAEFAERWDKELWRLAKKTQCQCAPPVSSEDESEHGPHCPVALFRQAGRLMCEEASELYEALTA